MREDYGTDHWVAQEVPLLPGEVADSDIRDDAEHWSTVYEEMIGFLVTLDSQDPWLERCRQRLTFWHRRRKQLMGPNDANRRSDEAAK